MFNDAPPSLQVDCDIYCVHCISLLRPRKIVHFLPQVLSFCIKRTPDDDGRLDRNMQSDAIRRVIYEINHAMPL